MYRECEDVKVARRVAQVCGQPHEVIVAGQDFLKQFPRYAERTVYISDGCADVSLCPDVYIYERARRIAPVRLTGNLGGEVLRGVVAFKASDRVSSLFSSDLRAPIHAAGDVYARTVATHPVSFAVFRQAPWHHFGTLALEQMQLSPRTPYLDNDLVKAAYAAPADLNASTEACLRLIADGNPSLRDIPTDRGVGGAADGILAAAARTWHAFLFRAEYAYDYGMPHWLARADRVLSPLRLERLFLGRHKFYHFRTWYRRQLSEYVQEVLLDPRSLQRAYVAPDQVRAIVQGHVGGQGNYTIEIHKLLTLELLHRAFVDSPGTLGAGGAENSESVDLQGTVGLASATKVVSRRDFSRSAEG
jgi:asparagine synthase (glutamine-hydrolysing)